MEKRLLGFAAVALLLVISAAPVLAQEGVAPEYKWAKGDPVRYKMTIEKKQTATGAQQMELTHSRWYIFGAQVTDVAPDGTATVETKVESAGLHLLIPSMKLDFVYDPDNPEDEKRKMSPLALPYTAILGEPITYKVSKKGKISGVAGFDKLGQKVLDAVKAAPNGASYLQLAQDSLGDLLSTQMEGLFRLMPDKPVKPGTLYKKAKIREMDPGLGSVILQTDYTLVGPEALDGDNSFKFTYQTSKTVETPAAGAAAPAAPAPAAKLTDAKGSGEFYLSVAKGVVTKSSFQSGTTVETTVPAADPAGAPGTVTQREDLKVTLGLAPAGEAPAAPPAEAPATPPTPPPAAGQPK